MLQTTMQIDFFGKEKAHTFEKEGEGMLYGGGCIMLVGISLWQPTCDSSRFVHIVKTSSGKKI